MIELTKENIEKINYNDIIAITIAAGGAMGEPNGFYAVTHDFQQYHLNLGFTDIKWEKLCEVFPVLETMEMYLQEIIVHDKGWNWFNMGFGNYLIVRNRYYNQLKKYITDNLNEGWEYGELYKKWFNILKIVCKTHK